VRISCRLECRNVAVAFLDVFSPSWLSASYRIVHVTWGLYRPTDMVYINPRALASVQGSSYVKKRGHVMQLEGVKVNAR